MLVLDAGTGIRELGRVLLREGHSCSHPLAHHARPLGSHHRRCRFSVPSGAKTPAFILYPLATTAQEQLRHNSILFDEIHFPVRAADIPAKIELIEADRGALAHRARPRSRASS